MKKTPPGIMEVKALHEHFARGEYDMTLRDWFAGQALGEAARQTREADDVLCLPSTIAATAYEIADAMLEARKTEDK